MQPGSAAAAGRVRLVSLLSFGLLSGVGVVVLGLYLLRKYRKSQNITESASKEEATPSSSAAAAAADDEGHRSAITDDAIEPSKNKPETLGESSLREKEDKKDPSEGRKNSENSSEGPHTSNAPDNSAIAADHSSCPAEAASDWLPEPEVSGQPETVSSTSSASHLKTSDSQSRNVLTDRGRKHQSDTADAHLTVKDASPKIVGPEAQVPGVSVPGSKGAKSDRQKVKDTRGEEVTKQTTRKSDARISNEEPRVTRKARAEETNELHSVHDSSPRNAFETTPAENNTESSETTPAENNTESSETTPAENNTESSDTTPGKVENDTEHNTKSRSVIKSKKSLPPVARLTPPPETKQPRRQRQRGVQRTSNSAEVQSSRSKPQWTQPLEDKTFDSVEVDTDSQQALWTTSPPIDGDTQSSQGGPWSSNSGSKVSGGQSRRAEFDDNFVEASPSKETPSQVTKQTTLMSATPSCALERKPLISDDEDDEEGLGREDVTGSGPSGRLDGNGLVSDSGADEAAADSNSEGSRLVEIDENCAKGLIRLTGENVDTPVRLASLKALVNLSWTTEKHHEYPPVVGQLFANIDSVDQNLRLESLRILANLSKNPTMVPHLLAAKAPACLLKLLVPEVDEEVLAIWLSVLDDVLWTSKEMCLTFASLPTEFRAASPETVYTGLYGLKNSRILKSRIFVLSRHRNQQITYLASRIYSCLTS